ncbi:agmatine deiminase family protein [Streptosporangium sp. NPDC000396]|uniref:agmatine deiminase family protein n=1 Tax=Streptosporangium sp. NPDC000396 TaxID=3366185 RepID=UPI0036885EC9
MARHAHRFNSWGGKHHPWDQDDRISALLLERLGVDRVESHMILESGAITVDGEGTLITTEQCLLNRNRNSGLSRAGIEAELKARLGVTKVIWLPYGGLEDRETDGHVDGVAAFTAPGKVLIQLPDDPGHPDYARMRANKSVLEASTDAAGRPFELIELPQSAFVEVAGDLVEVGYLNFYVANGAVVVPVAGVEADEKALAVIGAAFPGRTVVGVKTPVIAYGGGGVHCITQQIPAAGEALRAAPTTSSRPRSDRRPVHRPHRCRDHPGSRTKLILTKISVRKSLYMSRRQTLQTAILATVGGALSACGTPVTRAGTTTAAAQKDPAAKAAEWRMPDETHPHDLTFMSWPTELIWESDTAGVRRDIAGIARAIADFEPVVLLANPKDVKSAQRACGSGVEVVPIPVDDLWMRDIGPTFVLGQKGIAGVDFNFNGWGDKQEHSRDKDVAREILTMERVSRIQAPIVAEGGSIEVDGAGTLMATESSLINDNRNPGKTRKDIERALKETVGATTVIWVKGVKGKDITDYHIDALARFSEPGVVVISTPPEDAPRDVWTAAYDQARKVLSTAVDARGKRLELVELPEPGDIGRRGEGFLASYVNYYVVNGGVVLPRFGDRKADKDAAVIVRDLYPKREIVQVPVDTLGEGGGGIHCSTQQMPKRS